MKITLTVIAAMSTLGLLTACGATSAPGVAQLGSTPTPSAQAASSSGHSALAYAQCMRSHGVPDFPDPNSQGEFDSANLPASSPQFQAAQQACRNVLPGGGGQRTSGGAALNAQQQAQLLQFSKCMRSHGVPDFPDPSSHGLDLGSGAVDPQSPQFQSAQNACKSYLPGSGSGNTTVIGSGGANGQ
jgi:hypothetical protein